MEPHSLLLAPCSLGTLLKILSRITEPSEGRVASMVEVGRGFAPN